MAFIFTNDLHIDKGIWVSICLNYLDELTDFANEKNISTIVFGGDIFEKATKIKNEAFIPLFMKLMEMKNNKFKMFFILGNHDIFNDDNDSLIETFSPFGQVVKDSAEIEIDGQAYDALSYTKDVTKIPNKNNVLLTHLSIADFAFDNGYEVDQKNGMATDLFSEYDLVVSGHFHKLQTNKNIVFPGSPFQHNFGEEGQQKGFAIIEGNTWKFVPYTNAPTFLTIDLEDFEKYDYKNKFVQVKITNKIETFVKLKHILYSKGALEVKPYFVQNEELDLKNSVKLDNNGSVVSTVRQYLTGLKIENLDNDKLVAMFDGMAGEL
jgi:DNA repair exonuclease SbcCD nuclease subunit